jgi:hypothetical protein
MLYLGIDQHARQITISLRDENGDLLQARQVSTEPKKIHGFFHQLTREQLRNGESFLAVLEVCGFNDWLIRMLRDHRCHKVILIQPDERKKRKTDRRDAAALSELLWVNRDRLLQGKPVRGLRQVDIASSTDQKNRRLTMLRKQAGQTKTRLVNQMRHMLRRHNLQWEMPTKRLPTQAAIAWLKLSWGDKAMIDAHDFAQKQLELTAEFGKYMFGHPEVDDSLPEGGYVYFEVAGESEFNDYSLALAEKQRRETGAPIVRVRIQGLAPPQGSRLIGPVIEPTPAVA